MDKKGTKDFHFEFEFDLEKRVQEVARRNALLRMIDPEELNKEIQKNIEQYKTENSKKNLMKLKTFTLSLHLIWRKESKKWRDATLCCE